jgi:radical SAM-linked protein
LRRLDIPVFFSEGFNPKPVMSFSPALPLGVLSLAEYVELKLVVTPGLDLATLPEQLSTETIDGVRFVAAAVLGQGDPKLTRVIDEASYVVALPRAGLLALGVADEAALQAHMDARRSGELSVRRNVDGIGKRIDVSKYLLDARAGVGADVLRRAGLIGELMPVALRMRMTNDGSAKATEAIEALLGKELPVRCVRDGLYCTLQGERVTPLDLERLRSLTAAPHAPKGATDAVLE